LGPLLFTGLVLLAAEIALGLLVGRVLGAPAVANGARWARGPFIIHAAYIQGIGVLAVVEGLLAITAGPGIEPGNALVAAGPPLLGSFVTIAMILRAEGSRSPERLIGAAFVAGLGWLGLVVGLLAAVLAAEGAASPPTIWYLALAIVAAAGTLAIAESGARAAEGISASDERGRTAFRLPLLSVLFEIVAVAAAASAIALTALR
jgi:hypothetical protein